jgi:hypothetical protein
MIAKLVFLCYFNNFETKVFSTFIQWRKISHKRQLLASPQGLGLLNQAEWSTHTGRKGNGLPSDVESPEDRLSHEG